MSVDQTEDTTSEQGIDLEKKEETVEVPVGLDGYDDETVAKIWAKVVAERANTDELYAQLLKVVPPTEAEIDEAIESSEDEAVVALRAHIEDLTAQLDQAYETARETVKAGFDIKPEDEVEAIKGTFRKSREKVLTLLDLLRNLANTFGFDDVEPRLAKYTIPTLRGNRTTSRTDGAIIRPQVSEIVATKNGNSKKFTGEKARFSNAALYLKTDTKTLTDAWLASAGVDDWHKVNGEVEFEINDFTVSVAPKLG